MRAIIQVVLFVVAVVLGFMIIKSIQRPIEFDKAKKVRYDETIERLKNIRTAEEAYR